MNNEADEPPFDRPGQDVKLYVSLAKLPEMILGRNAPPPMPPGHKAHLNHLHVKPERHRKRLCNLISCRDVPGYDRLVKRFVLRLPTRPVTVPPQDERTGAAFTIPVHGLELNILAPVYPRPSTIHEITPWIYAYPFPTLTRVMQVSFPQAASWEFKPLQGGDIDNTIWQTFVWRKSPPALGLENFYRAFFPRPNPESSLIICVQPEWVLTEADIESFKKVNCFPLYSDNRDDNVPFNSAYRIWAKLWDLCVRAKCRFWVLTSYRRWIFGTFSQRFQAGHIFSIKSFDYNNPTVMETLVFHTAKSMGLANDLYLPEYFDFAGDDGGPPEYPHPQFYPEMEFPNSESEWEGMDDVPGISAGVSDYLDVQLSAYGSEANIQPPIVRIFRPVHDDIDNQPRPPPPPVAGPFRIRPRVARNRRARSSSYIAGVGPPHRAGVGRGVLMNGGLHEDDSDEDSDDVQPVPPPPPPPRHIRRRYAGVSRATVEVTDNVITWADDVEIDPHAAENPPQIDGINDENPNAITHVLSNLEAVYVAAMETVNPNGGPSLLVPQPPQQMIHTSQTRNTGGYLDVIPEVGMAREAEEAEQEREEFGQEARREAVWTEIQTNGVVCEGDGAGHDPDDHTWISQTHLVFDHHRSAAP